MTSGSVATSSRQRQSLLWAPGEHLARSSELHAAAPMLVLDLEGGDGPPFLGPPAIGVRVGFG